MITDLKSLGKRIGDSRKKRKISQNDFAEMLNISVSHLSDIETGKTNFGVDIFMHITEALQVSADDLLRTNISEVSTIYNKEFSVLTEDCTPAEMDSILKMVQEMKTAIRATKPKD